MKKFFALLLLLSFCLGLTACAGSYSTPASSTPPPAEEAFTAAESSLDLNNLADRLTYQLNTYTMLKEYSGGYSAELTLKIGSEWIRATDSDMIKSAWEAIGGTGEPPKSEDFGHFNSIVTNFASNTTIMLFGTISIKDTTQGDFSLSDASIPVSVWITPVKLNHIKYGSVDGPIMDACLYFNNGQKHNNPGAILDLAATMEGESWGPVPFVVCMGRAISPEYPNGDPEIFDVEWSFGDTFCVPMGGQDKSSATE